MRSPSGRLPLLTVCAALLSGAPVAGAVTPSAPVAGALPTTPCASGTCTAPRSQAVRLSARPLVDRLCRDSHCAPKRRATGP